MRNCFILLILLLLPNYMVKAQDKGAKQSDIALKFATGISALKFDVGDTYKGTPLGFGFTIQPSVEFIIPSFYSNIGVYYHGILGSNYGFLPFSELGINYLYFPYGHPPQQAKVAVQYSYAIQGTKPVTGLVYQILEGQSGMTFNSNTLKWTPATTGKFKVTIRVVDGSDSDTQSWYITVKASNQKPVISGFTQDCSALIKATEGATFAVTATGSDPDAADVLVHTWYMDNVWLSDAGGVASSVFYYIFKDNDFGSHTLKYVLTDGIEPAVKTCNIYVRNAIPYIDAGDPASYKVFPSSSIDLGLVNPKNHDILLSRNFNGAFRFTKVSPADFNASTDYVGCGSIPMRMSLDNTNPDANRWIVHFADKGDPDASNINYIKYTNSSGICTMVGTNGLTLNFFSNFPYMGGVVTAYNRNLSLGNFKRYYHVNQSAADNLRVFDADTSAYDADLGLGDDAYYLYSIDGRDRLFVAEPDSNRIVVYDSEDNSHVADIDTTTKSPSGQGCFAMDYDSASSTLYCYNGVTGVISVINAANDTYSFTNFGGLPSSAPLREKRNIFHVNTVDGLIYVLSAQNKTLAIWDNSITNSVQSITWSAPDNYEYMITDDSTGLLILVDRTNGRLARIK